MCRGKEITHARPKYYLSTEQGDAAMMQYRHIISFGLLLSSTSVVRSLLLSPSRGFSRKGGLASGRIVPLHATKEDDGTAASSSSLYQTTPFNKPWTFGILTSGFPPQQILVPVVKFVTFQVWRLMMNELVAHDEQGRFMRESFQAGNNPSPLDLPVADNDGPSYKLYLGNPCPWCHRVKAAVALLGIEDDIPITMLIDDAEKASKGGWILPKPSSLDISFGIADELIRGDLADVYNYCYRDVLKEGERYKGRCTAPLLVDIKSGKIVTNESNELIILLNDYARRKKEQSVEDAGLDLRPVGMEEELDKATKRWFDLLWNGSYRCGFATSQVAYDEVRHASSRPTYNFLILKITVINSLYFRQQRMF
jgi:glutathionyl-hydroquinone reductase